MTVSWGRRLVASVLAALTAAVVTHVGMLVVLLISQQLQAQSIGQNNTVFLPGSLIVFVLVFAVALLGGLRYWAVGLLTGLVAGFGGGFVSLLLNVAAAGTPVTADVVGQVFVALLGYILVFALIAAAVTPTLGRLVCEAVAGYGSAGAAKGRRVAIIRMPSAALASGATVAPAENAATHEEVSAADLESAAETLDTGIESGVTATIAAEAPAAETPVAETPAAESQAPVTASSSDADLVDQQWDAYVQALEAAGWSTAEAAFADKLADSVFVGDVVVVFDDVAVLTRAEDESRREETDGVEDAAHDLGLRIERIMSPGTLDGADVLIVGSTVYVGRGAGTNADGIRQLRSIVTALGYDVVATPLSGETRLTQIAAALPDGTVLVSSEAGLTPGFFGRSLEAPESHGIYVLPLGDDTVLISSAAPGTASLIEDLGYTVVTVDVTEFEKRGRGVTSLSALVR